MDNMENQPFQTPPSSGSDDVQAQFASLSSLLNSILVLVIVLSGVVDLYLVRQVKNTRNELTVARNFVAQAQRNVPAVDEFLRKLVDYGRAHPDFTPIMAKYGLKPQASTNAAPVGGTSAPAPKPK
jgi:hypothetical protein